jgi:hypothetical protein
MKYIITEEQNLRLKLIRRDQAIKELISLYSKRPLTNFHMVLEQIVVNLSNTFGIGWESKTFYFLKSYIKENYSDYIKTELKK